MSSSVQRAKMLSKSVKKKAEWYLKNFPLDIAVSRFICWFIRHYTKAHVHSKNTHKYVHISVFMRVLGCTKSQIVEVFNSQNPKKKRFAMTNDGKYIYVYNGFTNEMKAPNRTRQEFLGDVAYHGTKKGNVDGIQNRGLKPMGREIHMDKNVDMCALRGSKPVYVCVNTNVMRADGLVPKISKNGVVLYDKAIPPKYLMIFVDGKIEFKGETWCA